MGGWGGVGNKYEWVNGFSLVWSPAGRKKDCFFIDDLGKTRQDRTALYKEAKPIGWVATSYNLGYVDKPKNLNCVIAMTYEK